jgi:diacylglycerol kinase (ATP)
MTMPAPAPPADEAGGRIPVLWNRGAGRKAGLPTNVDLAEDELAALFERAGVAIELIPTDSEDDAVERTRTAVAKGAPAVIAAGGDGTVRTVARTLVGMAAEAGGADRVPPLGILPLGSVMNVARSLSIPRDLDEAARVVGQGTVRTIDALEAAGETFFEGVAVGLHAELFAEGTAFDEGDAVAPLRAVWTAFRYQPSRLTLHLDGDRRLRTRALVLSVSNGPYTGIGFTVAPGARLDDGLLDVRVFERFSRWELARHFLAIVAGRRSYEPRVETFRAATVRIESASPLRVRADGEAIGETPVDLRVLPHALRVLAPATTG